MPPAAPRRARHFLEHFVLGRLLYCLPVNNEHYTSMRGNEVRGFPLPWIIFAGPVIGQPKFLAGGYGHPISKQLRPQSPPSPACEIWAPARCHPQKFIALFSSPCRIVAHIITPHPHPLPQRGEREYRVLSAAGGLPPAAPRRARHSLEHFVLGRLPLIITRQLHLV